MPNACTIVAANYLPYASVLIQSFFAHHPEGSFTVLIVDDEDREIQPSDARALWLRLHDIGLTTAEAHRLAGIYEVTELSTAIKPILLKHLLAQGQDPVVYFDPDICIYRRLDDLAHLAATHPIVLTPHTTAPIPRDGRSVDPFFILAAGVYNLGFIAINRDAGGFLDWWWQGTRRDALVDVRNMMFTDQRWVDFVPAMFDAFILKEPTYNVAYWNLHGRALRYDGGEYRVNGQPLHFFHFSGYDAGKPWLLSKHQWPNPRVLLSEHPAVAQICGEYREQLAGATSPNHRSRPYGWAAAASGLAMTPKVRRLYRKGVLAAERGECEQPPDPFDRTNGDAFVAWLNAPAEAGPRRTSRYLLSIWENRVDLQIAFRDLFGHDGARYAHWCLHDGVVQEGIPDALVPPLDAEDIAPIPSPAITEGINVAGYFKAELGIGEAARLLVETVTAADIPHSTVTYDATLSRQMHPFNDRGSAGAHDINVLCVNADCTPRFAADAGSSFFAGRYTIGYWFWEVEEFPASMHRAFDFVDEVWAATDFVAAAIRSASRKPVFTMPLPVPVPTLSPHITRESLGLPAGFLFLFMFDFFSILERKNPLGLIDAFTRAFTPGEGPILVLKSINGYQRVEELERLRAAIAGRPDILLIDSYYSPEQKDALLGLCDCYVSLHRSEGLGLTMAEALALGKPVIATGYSGNLHFMSRENSYLVDYVSTPIPAGCGPYPTTTVWAEPDLHQAAYRLREVYERPDAAAAKGRRGREDVLTRHDVHASARAIVQRIEQIRAQQQNAVSVQMPEAPPLTDAIDMNESSSAIEAVENLLPHLMERSSPTLSAHGRPLPSVRVAAQRALFRLLRPYWFQRLQFDSHLISALRQICVELASLRRSQQTAIVQSSRDVHASSALAEQQWREAAGQIDTLRSALTGLQLAVSLLSKERAKLPVLQGDVAQVQRMAHSLERAVQHAENTVRTIEQSVARVSTEAADATSSLGGRVSSVERTQAVLYAETTKLESYVSSTIAGLQSLQTAVSPELERLRRELSEQADASRELTDVAANTASLYSDVTAFHERTLSLEAHLDDIANRNQSVAMRQDHFETNAASRLMEITDSLRTLESAVSALTERLSDTSYATEAARNRR